MFDRISNFIQKHTNGVALLVLACIMTIVTSAVMIVPRVRSLVNYNQVIDSLGGEEEVKKLLPNENDNDVFEAEQKEEATSYVDTLEYKNKQIEVNFKAQRYLDLTKYSLGVELKKQVSDYFSSYSEYINNPNPDNFNKLSVYTTDDFFENVLKKQQSNQDVYLVNDVLLSDLDKETILAYVEMRTTNKSFIVSYVNEAQKGFVISNVEEL